MAEACNAHYYHTTSFHATTSHPDDYVVVKLHIEQELLLKYLTSGQLLHFTRDYISYMLSIQTPHYIPTSQHVQHIYKVDYDMSRLTEIYSLKNNYIRNYHMPLLLPNLLHYLNHHDQLHDFQYKAITTLLHKSTHYYGFTLLTMTDLTSPQRLQLNNYLRNHNLQLAAPEIDDNRPDFNNYFVTHYFSTLDDRLKLVHNYRLHNWQQHA